MKPYNQKKGRYSGYDPYGPPTEEEWLGNTTTTTTNTGNGSTNSSSPFPWETLINTLGSLGTSIANIWSPAGNYTSQAWQAQYNQEKRTNTILWVVIGLVLALGVVLVIRKTK